MAETKQQQEIKKILEQLEGGVKELFESDRYKEFLCTMAKFHDYSLNNTLLIAMAAARGNSGRWFYNVEKFI